MSFRWLILLVSLLFFSIGCATPSKRQQLKKLDSKISSIRSDLHQERTKRQQLQQELKGLDLKINASQHQLDKINQQVKQQTQVLQELDANAKIYATKLDHQKAMLAKQLQTAYLLKREPYLKLVLNQQNPNALNRMLVYYHYFNQHRAQFIADIKSTLALLELNQQRQQTQLAHLHSLANHQQTAQSQLQKLRQNRNQLIASLNQQIDNKSKRLTQLLANKRALAKMIQRLNAENRRSLATTPFAKLRGHLRWPSRGHVIALFGSKISQSELQWEGDLIKAPDGQPIYAIASGKVVFADWLAGYGLLLIISHGNGYMTLYGRTHTLYKDVGDRVRAGDLIATIGRSGGYSDPALYFAIRHNAKPLDPAKWCSRRIA